jgi:transposase
MADKQYVNGMIIKEKTFDNGGTQLKVSLKVEELRDQLKELDDDGWVNLIITRRKEPSDAGVTHYAYVDPWKPTKQKTSKNVLSGNKDTMMNGDADDLPF